MLRRRADKMHTLRGNSNDWDNLTAEQLNRWQRYAKRTHGLLTPGNAITVVGVLLIVGGLYFIWTNQAIVGFIMVIAAKLADILDGTVAHTTKTKGKIGRYLDPTVDGFILLGSLFVMIHVHALPVIAALAVAIPKFVDGIASVIAILRHRQVSPTPESKADTVVIWLGAGSLLLSNAFQQHLPGGVGDVLYILGLLGMVGGSILKLPSTVAWVRIAWQSEQNSKSA